MNVFLLAIRLAKGKKLPLIAFYLDSLYARLDEYTNNIMCFVWRYYKDTHADTCWLQNFLLERFNGIAPKPMETTLETMVRHTKKKKKKSHSYMPRA